MSFVQCKNLCFSCKHYYMCDGECALDNYLESGMYVIECDDYEEGEPGTSYFDTLEKESTVHE